MSESEPWYIKHKQVFFYGILLILGFPLTDNFANDQLITILFGIIAFITILSVIFLIISEKVEEWHIDIAGVMIIWGILWIIAILV